jgi:DNA-binding GntR family transcriptional regulator
MTIQTRTDVVYDRIRSDILSGQIAPGSKLQFAGLKERYASSMGVLREALTRLTADGLVEGLSQQGFRAMSLSLDDLEDLIAARLLIETRVFAESVRHGDLAWETNVVAAHHRMERTPKTDDAEHSPVTQAWADAHQEFHEALCSAAPSRRLREIAASLRATAEVYRRWSMPLETEPRNVSDEHRELLDLAIARDADAAVEALSRHLTLTRDIIFIGATRPTS